MNKNLTGLEIASRKKYEVKIGGRLGPEPKDHKEVRVLNRVISWKNGGIHYEADPRHAEIIIRDLGLQNCSGVVTPCEREDMGKTGSSLKAKDATMYRALVARANFLAQDRSDIAFAVKRTKPQNE